MAGLYLHIPFCAGRCIYCDFYARTGIPPQQCVDKMVEELSERRFSLGGVPPSTVYFGGGTPSFLEDGLLERLASAIPGKESCLEFTIEVNPDDITPQKAAALKSLGAGRISMGVQSFCDEHLRWMRRRHSAAGAVEAFHRLREAGFDNISIDLIFGFTGLSSDDWARSVESALALAPEHISCYQMTGRHCDPDPERCRSQYDLLRRKLSDAGLRQYEVSNFAREGRHSRHNHAYWTREAYLGIGPAAHSFDGLRKRSWNAPDIDSYICGKGGGQETLSDLEVYEEKLMLGLRTTAGLDLTGLNAKELEWLSQKMPVLERLSGTGMIEFSDSALRIPAEELFVSDWIVGELIPCKA